ncbi:MAG: tetratricopeptide repeat protein [Cyanobacteriota bacterium]|nr:tetratricopeptide repeat protein [Cyanobacteriota bacterium]
MLGRIWRQLERWIRQVWRKIGPPQPPEPDSDNQPNPLSDAGYEQLWMEALDGVASGWDRERVLAHFGKRTEERVLKFWLQRFGRRLLESPVPNRELARRMVLLGGIWTTHPLAQTAAEIGNALLTRELPPLTEAEYESLFRELLVKTAQGEAAVSAFWQEMAARGTEADWVVWLRGYGKMLLAEAEPNQRVAKALVRLGEFGIGSAEVGIGEGDGDGKSLAKLAGEIGAQMREREVIWEIWEYVEGGNSEGGVRSSESGDGNAEEWLERGKQQYNAGDLEGALESFERVVELKPDDHIAWYNRGIALRDLGRFEEAVASYDRAVELHDDHTAWYNRGIALRDLGRFEEAVASFDRAVEIKPDDHMAWSNRGIALRDLGRFEEAVASYDRAVEIKPDDHMVWVNRGALLCDCMTQYEEAVASFNRAVELKPDFRDAWYNRGNALQNLGHFEEALASYDRAVELQSDYPEAWSNRGVALQNLGCFEEALASYDRAVELQSDYPEAWVNRGALLCDCMAQYEEALASFDRVLELKPDLHQAWSNRGVVLEKLGRYEEALASYDRAVELQPDNPNCLE